MSNQAPSPNYIELAAEVVSAFVSNNSVPASDLPGLIGNVHRALRNVAQPAVSKLAPAVPLKKSITADHLFSLEDGKPYKSLRRHLKRLGLTPEVYRQKWGLPHDYPMVAPNFAAKRSELARAVGLGQKRSKNVQAKAAAPEATTISPSTGDVRTQPSVKRGRKNATDLSV